MIWACPLTFEFLRLFYLFGFLTALSSLLILEISFFPNMGVILVEIFHEKKFNHAQQGITRDIFILECERDNKDDIFFISSASN